MLQLPESMNQSLRAACGGALIDQSLNQSIRQILSCPLLLYPVLFDFPLGRLYLHTSTLYVGYGCYDDGP